MSECRNCKPELGECDFCPYSSSGKMNIAERGGPTETDNLPDIDLYDPVLSTDLDDY